MKCATFDKQAQDAIPKEIRDKMNFDRQKNCKHEKIVHIDNFSDRMECVYCEKRF